MKILGILLQIITGIATFITTFGLIFSFALNEVENVQWLMPTVVWLYLSWFTLHFLNTDTGKRYQNFVGINTVLICIIGVGALASTIMNVYGEKNMQLGGIGFGILVYCVLFLICAFSDEYDWQ
jgi:hypothetical protein